MCMVELRDYQNVIVQDARIAMRRGCRRILITSPTGSGKTALTAHMIGEAARRGNTALFLVHRVELFDQTEATFTLAGIPYGVIAAGRDYVPGQAVYIGSIDTVRRRLERIPRPDMVVVDEAAHSPAKSWTQVVDAWQDAWRIGLTATPQRLSGEGFDGLFDELVLGPSTADLIAAGWLAPYRYYAPPGVDPSGLHVRAGDYVPAEAAALMDKPRITGDAITHYHQLAAGKRAIVFCASIQHSKNVAEQFSAAGISARHVDGITPADERRAVMEDFRAGRLHVLTNVNIFAEGVDVPGMEALILLSPTRSLSLHLQRCGRVLRPAPSKTALILDHVNAVQIHGLPDTPREWTLYGQAKQQRSAANDNVPPIRVCYKCYAAYRPAPECPYCGAASKLSPREIKQREGELSEIVRIEAERKRRDARREQGRAKTLSELIEIGKKRGYKSPQYWARRVMSGRK